MIYLENIVQYVSFVTVGLGLQMTEAIMSFRAGLFHHSQPGDL